MLCVFGILGFYIKKEIKLRKDFTHWNFNEAPGKLCHFQGNSNSESWKSVNFGGQSQTGLTERGAGSVLWLRLSDATSSVWAGDSSAGFIGFKKHRHKAGLFMSASSLQPTGQTGPLGCQSFGQYQYYLPMLSETVSISPPCRWLILAVRQGEPAFIGSFLASPKVSLQNVALIK